MKSIIKNKVRVYILMTILLPVACCLLPIQSKGQNIEQGLRYMELNQYNHAKNFFLNALKQNPGDAQLWRYVGDIYYKRGNNDSAEYYYNKGIEANKEYGYNYAGIARIKLKKGDMPAAVENLDKSQKLMRGTKDAGFYVYIAEGYLQANNVDKALSYLDKAKDVNKALTDIYIMRGDIYMSTNAGQAGNEFERALFYNKNSTRAYYELGKLYVLAWNYDAALQAFQNALKIDSNYTPVYKDLGELYYRANKNKDAANAYAKYIAIAEVTIEDIARYAQMLYFSQNYLKSSQFIDRYLKSDSNNFVLLRLQSYNCYELGQFEKGLKAITRLFKLANDKENKLITSDYDYYAKLLTKNNKDSLAAIYYIKVIKLDSTKFGYYEDIAKSWEKKNNYIKAAEFYEKFMKAKKTPEVNDYYVLAKTCYIIISDPTIAIDSVTKKKMAAKGDSAAAKVIQMLPDKYNGYLYRARINSVLDKEYDYEKGFAKPYYEKVIEIMEPTADKYKRELIEAYSYLGYYYFVIDDKVKSKSYWEKILAIDPENETAKKAKEGLTRKRVVKKQQQ